MMMMRKIMFCIFGLVLILAQEGLGRMSEQDIYLEFRQANEAFREGNALSSDHAKAQENYTRAILGFEKVIAEGGVKNAKLYYNLGNAYLLKGDVGRAILNYRKAEKLDEANANIKKNLNYARGQRTDKIKVTAEKKVLSIIFFWHYDLSLRMKFTVGVVCFAALCLLYAVKIWRARIAGFNVLSVLLGIGLVGMALSAGIEEYNQNSRKAGVIVKEAVAARQGDGMNYPATFTEQGGQEGVPLHAGTEFILLEQRPGWQHIELTDGTDTWIPADGGETI